jgi:hypothetical protein
MIDNIILSITKINVSREGQKVNRLSLLTVINRFRSECVTTATYYLIGHHKTANVVENPGSTNCENNCDLQLLRSGSEFFYIFFLF